MGCHNWSGCHSWNKYSIFSWLQKEAIAHIRAGACIRGNMVQASMIQIDSSAISITVCTQMTKSQVPH